MNAWYGYGGYGPHGFGFPIGMIVFLLVIALVVVLSIYFTRKALRSRTDASTGRDILVERYAKGEITKEQFVEMRDVIERKTK